MKDETKILTGASILGLTLCAGFCLGRSVNSINDINYGIDIGHKELELKLHNANLKIEALKDQQARWIRNAVQDAWLEAREGQVSDE